MPININYQPAAGVVAGLGMLGGQGDYARWLNGYLSDQWGQTAQLNNSRLIAMGQASAEAQRQASQQQFQAQMMPQQAAIQNQQAAFQSQLGTQADAQRQILSSNLGAQQSQQDFAEQQALYAQQSQLEARNQAAQIAQQQQGQLYNHQAMATFNQDQQVAQKFQSDPFAEMRQNQQQAQQSGYSYSPDQQTRMATAKRNLSAMQDGIQSGQHTMATLLPDIKSNMAVLSSISANPDQAPPPDIGSVISQKVSMGLLDKTTGKPFPGTESIAFTLDKNGDPMVVRGYPKPGDIGGATANNEALTDMNVLKAGYGAEMAARKLEGTSVKEINAEVNQRRQAGIMSEDPSVWQPGWEQATRAQLEQEQAAIAAKGRARFEQDKSRLPQRGGAQTPSAPPAGITPQQPQGQQAPPQLQQAAPLQQRPSAGAMFDTMTGQQSPSQVAPQPQNEHAQNGNGQPSGDMVQKYIMNLPEAPLDEHQKKISEHYLAQGNRNAAIAINRMAAIVQANGQDFRKWDRNVLRAYLSLGMEAPEVNK